MAITLGKLTILVGAGVLGSVLAKEGRASDLLSGAFRIAFRQLKQDDSGKSGSSTQKPKNDLLLAQVNSLRQELQILASSNRSVTIVTATQAGTGKYGIIVITFVLGYGYIRWKGWKLPDMMFATRRSLSDACNSISKQLELVYSSIAVTKRKLSSQIDGIDQTLTEALEITSSTRQEVSELRGRADDIRLDVREVHETLQTIESRIMSIEGRQEITTKGIMRLCDVARNIEIEQVNQSPALPSSSSRPAIELLPSSPSVPGIALLSEPESPSHSNGSRTEGNGISKALGASDNNGVPNGNGGSEEPGNVTPSSGIFGMRFPGYRGPIFSRTLSASAANILDQTR